MRLSDYIKDKIMTYLLHLLCMILLTFFFYITGYNKNAVSLIRKRGHQVNNNGTKGAPFHVLIGSSMPGVLVEIGYCTNSAEARRLKQSKYRDALAEGIANGVHHYARQLELAGK